MTKEFKPRPKRLKDDRFCAKYVARLINLDMKLKNAFFKDDKVMIQDLIDDAKMAITERFGKKRAEELYREIKQELKRGF